MQENTPNSFSPEIIDLFKKLNSSIDKIEAKKRKTTGAFGGKRKNDNVRGAKRKKVK